MSQAPEARGGAAVAGVAAVKGGSIHEEEITKLYVITWKMDIYIFFEKWTSNFEMSDCFKLSFIFL